VSIGSSELLLLFVCEWHVLMNVLARVSQGTVRV